MTDCLDSDALLALQEALEWDGTAGMTHLARCADCRGVLAELELLHSAVAPLEPDQAFVSRITASLACAHAAEREPAQVTAGPTVPAALAPRGRVGATPVPVLDFILFVVSTSTIWSALAFARAALDQPEAVSIWDPSLLLLAALGGAAACWRTRREAAGDWVVPPSQSILR